MPGENPSPDLLAAELIAFGLNETVKDLNVINEYNTDSASNLVTHFFSRRHSVKAQVLWDTKQIVT